MAETTAGTALAPLNSGPREVSTAHTLSAAAMQYARQSLSPATRRAYASHLRAWEAWCESRGALPWPRGPRPWSPTTWRSSPANAPTSGALWRRKDA